MCSLLKVPPASCVECGRLLGEESVLLFVACCGIEAILANPRIGAVSLVNHTQNAGPWKVGIFGNLFLLRGVTDPFSAHDQLNLAQQLTSVCDHQPPRRESGSSAISKFRSMTCYLPRALRRFSTFFPGGSRRGHKSGSGQAMNFSIFSRGQYLISFFSELNQP